MVELDSDMILTISLFVRDIPCHNEYDMESLSELVIMNNKRLPEYVVPYVVRTAVESARFESKNHHEIQCYQHITGPVRLSQWTHGRPTGAAVERTSARSIDGL